VNVLCDNALLTGYALGRKEIDAPVIREVAEDLNIASNVEGRVRPIRQVVNNTSASGLEQVSGAESMEVRPGFVRFEAKAPSVKPGSKGSSGAARIPTSFLEALTRALADAMGPMAHIVLRDQIRAIGESADRFPNTKLEMIIDSVSAEILDETMRQQFRKRMNEHVRSLQTQ